MYPNVQSCTLTVYIASNEMLLLFVVTPFCFQFYSFFFCPFRDLLLCSLLFVSKFAEKFPFYSVCRVPSLL
jgi:hypothetical protein